MELFTSPLDVNYMRTLLTITSLGTLAMILTSIRAYFFCKNQDSIPDGDRANIMCYFAVWTSCLFILKYLFSRCGSIMLADPLRQPSDAPTAILMIVCLVVVAELMLAVTFICMISREHPDDSPISQSTVRPITGEQFAKTNAKSGDYSIKCLSCPYRAKESK